MDYGELFNWITRFFFQRKNEIEIQKTIIALLSVDSRVHRRMWRTYSALCHTFLFFLIFM